MVDDPHNWMEAAAFLESGDTAALFELFPKLRVKWGGSARRRQVRVREQQQQQHEEVVMLQVNSCR